MVNTLFGWLDLLNERIDRNAILISSNLITSTGFGTKAWFVTIRGLSRLSALRFVLFVFQSLNARLYCCIVYITIGWWLVWLFPMLNCLRWTFGWWFRSCDVERHGSCHWSSCSLLLMFTFHAAVAGISFFGAADAFDVLTFMPIMLLLWLTCCFCYSLFCCFCAVAGVQCCCFCVIMCCWLCAVDYLLLIICCWLFAVDWN